MCTDNEGVKDVLTSCQTTSVNATPVLSAILQLEFDLKWTAWFSRVPTESNIADDPSRGQIQALLDQAVHQQQVDQTLLWEQVLEFATRGGVDQHRDALVEKEVLLRGQLDED